MSHAEPIGANLYAIILLIEYYERHGGFVFTHRLEGSTLLINFCATLQTMEASLPFLTISDAIAATALAASRIFI